MKKIFLIAILLSRQIFTNAQNVGIGISNPTKAKLEVHGAVGSTSAIFGGESAGISLQRNWPAIGFNQYLNSPADNGRYMANGFAASQFLDPTSGTMGFDMFSNGIGNTSTSNPKRAITILYNGNVGIIGPGAITASLVIEKGTNNIDGTAIFGGSTYHSYFNHSTSENTYIRAGKDNGTVFINDIPGSKISMSGSVGINILPTTYPLHIKQTHTNKGLLLRAASVPNDWGIYVNTNNQLVLEINSLYRGAFSPFDGTYSSVSDKRLKTNIQSLPSLLNNVMQLQPVAYEMIHNNAAHKKGIGFIAQDVKQFFPELVSVIRDTGSGYKNITDLHTINYSGFGVLAIKAVQEQQTMIQSLQAELGELKREIIKLKEPTSSVSYTTPRQFKSTKH